MSLKTEWLSCSISWTGVHGAQAQECPHSPEGGMLGWQEADPGAVGWIDIGISLHGVSPGHCPMLETQRPRSLSLLSLLGTPCTTTGRRRPSLGQANLSGGSPFHQQRPAGAGGRGPRCSFSWHSPNSATHVLTWAKAAHGQMGPHMPSPQPPLPHHHLQQVLPPCSAASLSLAGPIEPRRNDQALLQAPWPVCSLCSRSPLQQHL